MASKDKSGKLHETKYARNVANAMIDARHILTTKLQVPPVDQTFLLNNLTKEDVASLQRYVNIRDKDKGRQTTTASVASF